MKKELITTKLFSLSCEKDKSILSKIIGTFTRPGYEIATLSQSRTDVSDVSLITLEVFIPGMMVDNMIQRLQKIIGVIDVSISFGDVEHAALYRLLLKHCKPEVWAVINRYNTRLLTVNEQDELLIHQIGRQVDIRRLYNELDGPALISFSQQAVPVTQQVACEGGIAPYC